MVSLSSAYAALPAFDESSKEINVIIETPQGSQNKYKWDPELGLFELSAVMPEGHFFPYDFGYIPSTLGEDGDPEDVLILMDSPTFVGCRIRARLIGVLEATQTERNGRKVTNNRLIAVAPEAHNYQHVEDIADIEKHRLKEIEHFFVSYNALKNRTFKPRGFRGPRRAAALLRESNRRYQQKNSRGGKS